MPNTAIKSKRGEFVKSEEKIHQLIEIEHDKFNMENHLVVLTWFNAICLVIIIAMAAVLLVVLWFGLVRKQNQKAGDTQSRKVTYQPPDKLTLFNAGLKISRFSSEVGILFR